MTYIPNHEKESRRLHQGVGTFRGPLLPSRRGGVPESLKRYAGFVLLVVADALEERYARATEHAGISLRDFVLMAEIAQRQGLSQATLARHVGLARSRVSEQLLLLDSAGYIERELDIRDLRRRRIWLSAGGQVTLEDAAERVSGVDSGWLSVLDPVERHNFTAALRRLRPATTKKTQWL